MRKIRTTEENNVIGRKTKQLPITVKHTIKVEDIPVPQLIAIHPEKLSLWNLICADLSSRDLLKTTYLHVIEMLVHNVVIYHNLTKLVEKEDTTYLTQTMAGETIIRSNPVFDQYIKIQHSIYRDLTALGMTPRDIIYTSNPAATAQIKEVEQEHKKVTYFK